MTDLERHNETQERIVKTMDAVMVPPFAIYTDTAKWFRTMCSLGRLCDNIGRALDHVCPGETITGDQGTDAAYAIEDLAQLKKHLMVLENGLRDGLVAIGVEKAWDNNTAD